MTQSGDGAAIDALCEAHGVATRYTDVFGNVRETSDTSKRAILAAMGVLPPGDPARPQMLPPLVREVNTAATIIVQVRHLRTPARWQLACESGARYAGTCVPAQKPGADAREAHPGAGSTGAALAVADIECSGLAAVLHAGYHRLSLIDTGGEGIAAWSLIAHPPRCAIVGEPGTRMFGPAIQLYALRSQRNWGIGDFTDLAAIGRAAAREGADFVGINPLHALFLDRPSQASPYSPSSRLALNPLYLDVEAMDDYAECAPARAMVDDPAFQAQLERLRAAPMVDYAAVARVKLGVVGCLYEHFREHHLETPSARGRSFHAFAARNRATLGAQAAFDAARIGYPPFDDAGPAVAADDVAASADAARATERATQFHLYLQWQADRQLAAAHSVARHAGMRVGLYRDMAVGANPDGAEVQHDPSSFAIAVQVGAPPDAFNEGGQDWGLPPWIPQRLTGADYAPWRALLHANMQHAGVLRIDHVMALMRLFWIPRGAPAADGTYVGYPFEDLLGVLALESTRNRCTVVGEDLGTVADSLRTGLAARGVLSYRVLFFERGHDDEFLPPAAYPAGALVCVGTHDLPTLQGYWQSADIAARRVLAVANQPRSGESGDKAVDDRWERRLAERAGDKQRLARALRSQGLPAPDDAAPALDFDHVCAVHAYVARTACSMMAVQLEDVFGEVAQVNLPATGDDEYPNWRRKIPLPLEEWETDGRFARVCASIRAEGRGTPPHAATS